MADDETPSYAPNEVAAQRVARSVQHHGGPTTGMGAELPALIQHYYERMMSGPRAMEQVAHGEMDPTSPEGIGAARGIAMGSFGMRSAFPGVPRSLGSAGGKMIQPGKVPGYAPSEAERYMHSPTAMREGEVTRYAQSPTAARDAGATPPPNPYPPPAPSEATARYAPDAPFVPLQGVVSKVPEQDTAPLQQGLQSVMEAIGRKKANDVFGKFLDRT